MAGAVDDPSHDGVDPQRTVDANGQGGVRNVKSAARAVEVLEMLAARQNRPARLKELSEALHMPRSSLYALMRTLVARGWVPVSYTHLTLPTKA